MNLLTIYASWLGLALGVFNFYWSNLRKKRALYMVPVHRFTSLGAPEFALVNGGNVDVLITEVVFEYSQGGHGLVPPQKVNFGEQNGRLLGARKAVHCWAELPKAVPIDFATCCPKEENLMNMCAFILNARVQWAEMDGTLHNKTVQFSKLGVDDDGNVRVSTPMSGRCKLS